MLFILRHYIKDSLHACNYKHFSNCMSTVNEIMHLTHMDKFIYMQACLTSSIITCMHAMHIITLKHCLIVAMGMTLLQLPNSLSST